MRSKKGKKTAILCLIAGVMIGGAAVMGTGVVFYKTSTNESCEACHIHPESTKSWEKSVHHNSKSGVVTNCVDCHLPPKGTLKYYVEKVKTGGKDVWSYITKDSTDINWSAKNELEHAQKFVYNESCIKCHENIFTATLSDDGLTSHLYYESNAEKENIQCISCHLDAGHYNPNYSHSQMSGLPQSVTKPAGPIYDTTVVVSSYETFEEIVPGTSIKFKMVAIPAGEFKMGSPDNEQLRLEDEGPVRDVSLDQYFIAETEVTWDQYWAFFAETLSEGRTLPESVYANNGSNPDVDAISGPTPPFGIPDQGWGSGDRPAITMTHYSAEVFCMWLSKKTGRNYRLPTEAEWEYAARGGSETPYFFEGKPNKFYSENFWSKLFGIDTVGMNRYVSYMQNSNGKTKEPREVLANPFGLKNMYGNVMEYCADKYAADAYSKTDSKVSNPINLEGEEWVVRGGNYQSDADKLRSASRGFTEHVKWLKTDPQQPKSIWWYSDIKGIGFRVVCTLE